MGWTNSDNKFGPTSFVVGTVLGDGANYTSIQQAITDAGAGPVDVYIRPGTYTENLSFNGNVYLIAASMSGEISPPVGVSAHVNIVGDHNINQNALTVCKGIYFNSVATAFTIEDVATAGVASLELENCTVVASTAFVLGGATGNGQIKIVDSQVDTTGRCLIVNTGSVGGFYELLNSTFQSTGDGCVFVDTAVSQGIVRDCSFVGTGASPFTFDLNSAGATLDVQNTYMQSPSVACITFQAAASVTAYHNTYNTAAGSEYITGPGNYTYGGDVIFPVQGAGIDGAAVQTKTQSRPFAETGTGTSTDVRGSACFDSVFFSSTDGFMTYGGSVAHSPIYELDGDTGSAVPLGPFGIQVSILGKAGCTTEAGTILTNSVDIYALKYISIIASGTAVSDFGHFITTTVTTTLPAAPDEGTVVSFILSNAGAIQTIQAPGAAKIRIGANISSAGGTAVSSMIGDHLRLVYRLAPSDTWFAEEVIGTWALT